MVSKYLFKVNKIVFIFDFEHLFTRSVKFTH